MTSEEIIKQNARKLLRAVKQNRANSNAVWAVARRLQRRRAKS